MAIVVLTLALAGCGSTPTRTGPGPSPDPVARTAQEVLGHPYRWGGNGPGGFDCSGLVQYAHHRGVGARVPRTAREQLDAARPVGRRDLRAGDLVFFSPSADKSVHVGIYVEDHYFVHAPSSGKRVSYARLDTPYWSRSLLAAGRLR